MARRYGIKPRCRHCAHPFSKHEGLRLPCWRCASCPGYEPARGIKQKRATPTAALRRACNELWSRIIRAYPGGCECPRPEHRGPYAGAHGLGKKSYPAVRHDIRNGWKLASGCHRFYTGHPVEWLEFMEQQLGPEAYADLRAKALANQKPDLVAVLSELRAIAAERGIK